MARPSSKHLILDIAEELFATQGIDAVSLRQINEELGLSPAAVHYHFKNKALLLNAVLERRLRLEGTREPTLNKMLKAELPVTARHIAEALILPAATIFIEDGKQGEYFVQIIAQVYADKRQVYIKSLPDSFKGSVDQFTSLLPQLNESLPRSLPIASLELRYRFAVISCFDCFANFEALCAGNNIQPSKQEFVESLIQFIANSFIDAV